MNLLTILFIACIGVIIYTYFGYPLILAIAGYFQKDPEWLDLDSPLKSDEKLPFITLIIAAYNEERVIEEKLKNSLGLDYPQDLLQIVVAGDDSSDQTVEIVRSFSKQRIELCFKASRQGKMAAINRAILFAEGEIIVFSDANNMYAPDALRMLASPFADSRIGGVSGSKKIIKGDGPLGESEGLYWKYEAFIKKMETRLGSSVGAVGEIFAMRKALYEAPPDHIINDDFYLASRLVKRGYRVVYQPGAKSYERVSLTSEDESIRRARIVSGRYQALMLAPQLMPFKQPKIVWQLISHKFLRPIVPLTMIGAFVVNFVSVLSWYMTGENSWVMFSPIVDLMLLILQTAFYLLAFWGASLEQVGKISKILYVPTFFVSSNVAAIRGLWIFLSGRESTLWTRAKRRGEGSTADTKNVS